MADPIELSLKTEGQVALARLQDRVVEALFNIDLSLVMHGGTAVWRCYGGNRFSEDIDMYATDAQVKRLSNELTWALSKRGVKLEYSKHSNRILEYYDDFARSKLEAMLPPKGLAHVQREYTRSDGTRLPINTLSANGFIMEKIATYQSRRYVRDLYDIYHLLNNEKLDAKSIKALKSFSKLIERPIDEAKLVDLVYIGVAPTFETMKASICGKAD
ncbi:MAG TPA: nucleotidyl transferase AbiEii/AbiGii toxin family protein [Candidatus Acidoferrales bacterium]|nr:nucleotidyl transferase AbiEii/AbiGii toxin family protein [Candidatus Acidoferrales bacterium]